MLAFGLPAARSLGPDDPPQPWQASASINMDPTAACLMKRRFIVVSWNPPWR